MVGSGTDPTPAASGSTILLRLPREGARRWHLWLAEALARLGRLAVEQAEPRNATSRDQWVRILDHVERRLYRIVGERASEPIPSAEVMARAHTGRGLAPDLVIDLEGLAPLAGRARTIVPLLDGQPADAAAASIVLAGRLPYLSLRDSAYPAPLHLGLCAIERPEVLCLALDGLWSRVGLVLLAQVEAILTGRRLPDAFAASGAPSGDYRPAGHPLWFGIRTIRHKMASRVARAIGRERQWRIAYRRLQRDVRLRPGLLNISDYRVLQDDGQRYYGDPFGIEYQGETWVFCEEVPAATRKGIISATRLLPDGSMPTPRPVLECCYHLSYPQLIRDAGAIWMLPESSANRSIELFRAVSFPDRWERHATLLQGDFHDATLFRHGEAWWIMATERAWQASSWDTLRVFHAPALEGPWRPVTANPVVMDARYARPAGAPFLDDGRFIRPVQDCSAGYGSAIYLAEVTRLAPDGFAQRIIGRIAFRPEQRMGGPHTLNRVGDWELIDLYCAEPDLLGR